MVNKLSNPHEYCLASCCYILRVIFIHNVLYMNYNLYIDIITIITAIPQNKTKYANKQRQSASVGIKTETWREIIVNFIGLFTVPKMVHAFLMSCLYIHSIATCPCLNKWLTMQFSYLIYHKCLKVNSSLDISSLVILN